MDTSRAGEVTTTTGFEVSVVVVDALLKSVDATWRLGRFVEGTGPLTESPHWRLLKAKLS